MRKLHFLLLGLSAPAFADPGDFQNDPLIGLFFLLVYYRWLILISLTFAVFRSRTLIGPGSARLLGVAAGLFSGWVGFFLARFVVMLIPVPFLNWFLILGCIEAGVRLVGSRAARAC